MRPELGRRGGGDMALELLPVEVERLTTWGEPILHGGELVRMGPVTKLYHYFHRTRPRALRRARVHLYVRGTQKWLVHYLGAAQTPTESPETPVTPECRDESIRVNEAGLLPWQVAPVRRLKFFWSRGERRLADLSDTGTGKTYVYLALVRELRRTAVVVTLKSALYQWEEAAAHMGVPCRAWNYEALKTRRHPWVRWRWGRDNTPWPQWLVDPAKVVLAFDEAQRCKDWEGSLNSKLLLQAVYQRIPLVMISATLATDPVNMRASGYALGLHANADFLPWLERHGCFATGKSWLFSNDRKVIRSLHAQIFARNAVRVRKAELGQAFPGTLVEPWLMDFPAEVGRRYQELAAALAALAERAQGYVKNSFTVLLEARQRVEMLKVPAVVEMARDLAEEGLKVVLFFNFDEPLREASRLLGGAPLIVGGQDPRERRRVQAEFQADKIPFLCCNEESGGAALSLHGRAERATLIMPTFKADTLRQVLGRVQRAGGAHSVQRVIFARGTVEEDMARNLRRKLDNLDTLNDGDTSGNLRFLNLPKS